MEGLKGLSKADSQQIHSSGDACTYDDIQKIGHNYIWDAVSPKDNKIHQ
jgi:hypothetical protein